MNIDVRKFEDRKTKLVFSDANPPLVNALRRVLIADVPSLAIEDVELHLGAIGGDEQEYESNTPLFDEIIAHRLGMIPIPTDLELFEFKDECDECGGEGCPNCTVMYSLNKKGPGTVYSGDLTPVGESDLRVVDDLIPIVKLEEDQAILLYATAEMGTAKEHAKWQPTSGVGYKYYPQVEIDNEKCDLCRECIEECPVDILKEEDGELIVTDVESCKLCNACEEACTNGGIKVQGREDKIIMRYETDGSLTTEQTLKKALEILDKKFGELEEMIEEI